MYVTELKEILKESNEETEDGEVLYIAEKWGKTLIEFRIGCLVEKNERYIWASLFDKYSYKAIKFSAITGKQYRAKGHKTYEIIGVQNENMLELRFKCSRKHNQCSYIRLKKPQRAFKGISTEKLLIMEEEEHEKVKKMVI